MSVCVFSVVVAVNVCLCTALPSVWECVPARVCLRGYHLQLEALLGIKHD